MDGWRSGLLSETPPGWNHNPSSKPKRLVIEVLALCGAAVSIYLALYQLRVLTPVWDPIFGSASSRAILRSTFSESLPIPDGLLGFFAYMLEFGVSRFGDKARWQRAPWKVALNAMVAFALMLAALLLVSLQGLFYHHWCTLCLCSATLSVSIGLLTADELYAIILYLAAVRRSGGNGLLAFAGDFDQALLDASMRPAA